jgi:Ca2+-binding RTX toxin-like protein
MCEICQVFRPFDTDCAYRTIELDGTVIEDAPQTDKRPEPRDVSPDPTPDPAAVAPGPGGPGGSSPLPFFDNDQIADQLTTGYWGGSTRSYDAAPGDTLAVDLSDLTPAGQVLARSALDSWTAVTGIAFVDFVQPTYTTVQEGPDAAANLSTTASLTDNQIFEGSLNGGSGDIEDWIEVQLVAGTVYQVEMNGITLADPYLYLYDDTGDLLLFDDDGGPGRDSVLTFTVNTTGTYYLGASYWGTDFLSSSGTYELVFSDSAVGAAHITFDDEDSGAYASSVVTGGETQNSFINVDDSWNGGEKAYTGYTFQTYIHEIGHALGLGHAGDYNGAATFGVDNHYANESWQATVMSYFDQDENTNVNASFAYTTTPMMADIIAVQNLYGSAVTARPGDTVYGANSNLTDYLGDLFGWLAGEDAASPLFLNGTPVAFTIFDSDGTDLIDLSFDTQDQCVDLGPETYSDVLGLIGNMGIARNTIIENFEAGRGDDHVTGNGADNRIAGNEGNDTIDGAGGNDTIEGGDGADSLNGGSGDDALTGGGGNDSIEGRSGDDDINGNRGDDDLSGLAGNDTVLGALGDDNVSGGGNDDRLYGSAGNDTVDGGGGNDVAYGGDGADTVTGGSGNDFLSGGAGDDLLVDGDGSDKLRGDGGADVFELVIDARTDRVADFEDGTDIIRLHGAGSFADLDISDASNGTVRILYGGDTLVLLEEGGTLAASQLSAVDFEFV